jgi:hypothetical protein
VCVFALVFEGVRLASPAQSLKLSELRRRKRADTLRNVVIQILMLLNTNSVSFHYFVSATYMYGVPLEVSHRLVVISFDPLFKRLLPMLR